MKKARARCEATIVFFNDQLPTGIAFQCELPEGHRGRHQCSGLSHNAKFTITWEEFALEKNRAYFVPQLGTA